MPIIVGFLSAALTLTGGTSPIFAQSTLGRATTRPDNLSGASRAQFTRVEQQRDAIAAQYGLTRKMVTRLAKSVLGLNKIFSDADFVSAVREQANTGRSLLAENRRLVERVRALEDPAVRDPALALLQRAQQAIDEGRFEAADADLRVVEPLLVGKGVEADRAWLSVINARINIADMSFKIADVTALQKYKATTLISQSDRNIADAWGALSGAAFSNFRYGYMIGNIDAYRDALKIYDKDMRDFLKKFPDPGREKERKVLIAKILSAIASREVISDYSTANNIFVEYLEESKKTECWECFSYGLTALTSNVSSMIFRSRNVENLKIVEPYLSSVPAITASKIDRKYISDLYTALAGLYGMAGEVRRDAVDFDNALQYAQAVVDMPGSDDQALLGARFVRADIYRQRGDYLREIAYSDKAIAEYEAMVPIYQKMGYRYTVGLLYKRLGSVRYTVGTSRSDCAALRKSQDDIETAMRMISQADSPGEYAGLVVMRDRNAPLLTSMCRQ